MCPGPKAVITAFLLYYGDRFFICRNVLVCTRLMPPEYAFALSRIWKTQRVFAPHGGAAKYFTRLAKYNVACGERLATSNSFPATCPF